MPPMLPDELIYSFLGRVASVNALGSALACLDIFFGTRDIVPSVDLPTKLDILHRRLGSFSPKDSAIELIESGTLYPYHRPFLAPHQHHKAQHALLHGSGVGLKTFMGRVANRFGAHPPLRYCGLCLQSDLVSHGTSYWHRCHQIPGVTSCITHGINLVVHVMPSMLAHKKQVLLPPGQVSAHVPQVPSLPQQIRFAALSKDLLEAGLAALEPKRREDVYKERIAELGFVRKGRIDHNALASDIRSHYQNFEGFVHRDRLLATDVHPLAWLWAVLHRPGTSLHPICHLLLIRYLFGSLAEFSEAMQREQQPSSQKSTTGQITHSIRSTDIDSVAADENLLLDLRISCRSVAQTLGVSVTTVVSRRRALGVAIAERRKYLTDCRLQEIATDLSRGLPIVVIARLHEVSISTVYRTLNQSPQLNQVRAQALLNDERLKRRQLWQEATSKLQGGGVNAGRLTAAATYAWLYRNDREWLEQSCRPLRATRRGHRRVNWEERDDELCRRLRLYIDSLMTGAMRPRISKTLMLRHLGEAMVRANLVRLPQLQRLLDSLAETLHTHRMFRIDCAIDAILKDGKPLILWRIQREAGVRKLTAELHTYIKRKVTEKCRNNRHAVIA